jgi:hypothetical protein
LKILKVFWWKNYKENAVVILGEQMGIAGIWHLWENSYSIYQLEPGR